MFINVIIPSCPLHIKYIDKALTCVLEQTRKADRIVCVVNEYTRYKGEYLAFEKKFNTVHFVKSENWNVAGVNRKLGTEYVLYCDLGGRGDKEQSLIVYHDVDDLMYKGKLEHVEKLFLVQFLLKVRLKQRVWKCFAEKTSDH